MVGSTKPKNIVVANGTKLALREIEFNALDIKGIAMYIIKIVGIYHQCIIGILFMNRAHLI